MAAAKRDGGLTSKEDPPGWEFAITYELDDYSIDNDLQASGLAGSLGITVDTPALWRQNLPPWYSPPLLSFLNLKLTPSIAFGVEIAALTEWEWDTGGWDYTGTEVVIEPKLSLAAALELQAAYGVASAGLKMDSTFGYPFRLVVSRRR